MNKHRGILGRLALLTALSATACATTPTGQPEPHPYKKAEAIYAVPKDHPAGELHVRFYGIEKVPPGQPAAGQAALHLEMTLSNKTGHGEWRVAANQLTLSLKDGTRIHAISAKPDSMKVEPKGLFGMDVYFPVPPEVTGPDGKPKSREFSLNWEIRGEHRDYTQTSHIGHAAAGPDLTGPPETGMHYDIFSGALVGGDFGWFI